MELNYYKGQKLTIYLNDDEFYFKGEFLSMNGERNRISLTDVIRYPDQLCFPKEYHFFRAEIKYVLSEDAEDGMEVVLDPTTGRILSHHKPPTHAHLYRMNSRNAIPGASKQKPVNSRKNHDKYPKYQKLLENYVIVDKIDETFHEMVSNLNKTTTIGVSLEGELIGRKGKLSWLNVSSDGETILFDILNLGQKAFDEGLRDLLQSNDVTKVIHDCRMAADCLLYQYKTKLINVVDTQVLDLIVMRTPMERVPTYVTSLNDCLQRYLNIPEGLLIFPIVREHYIKLDSMKWKERPLKEEQEALAVQNVVFLLDLRLAQQKAIMEPVRQATQIYLGHVTSMTDQEAGEYYGCVHMTPRKVYGVGKRKKEEDRGMERVNPNIRFSRDVMHHFDSSYPEYPNFDENSQPSVVDDTTPKVVETAELVVIDK